MEVTVLQARETGAKLLSLTPAQRKAFYDGLLLRIATVEGLTPPAPDSTAYKALQAEINSLFFEHPQYSHLTQAEVLIALRLNADGQLAQRHESYRTISRRWLAAVVNEYLRLKSDTLFKFDGDAKLLWNTPEPDKAAAQQETDGVAWLALAAFEAFIQGTYFNPAYLYPGIYDWLIEHLHPRFSPTRTRGAELNLGAGYRLYIAQLERSAASQQDFNEIRRLKLAFDANKLYDADYPAVLDAAKRVWVIDLYRDLREAPLHLKEVLHHPPAPAAAK